MNSYEVLERLKADLDAIRLPQSRKQGSKGDEPLRWVGEPYGFRKLEDMAKDVEALIELVTGSKGI